MHTNKPLLTISIPTYNRASYLRRSLEQLWNEIQIIGQDEIEIIVSNNASVDETTNVVGEWTLKGLKIKYLNNEENVGGDTNIALCFDHADGDYVLILGDDDLFVDGGLVHLMNHLRGANFGVVCMRPYGYNVDFRSEYPGKQGTDVVYDSQVNFLNSIGQYITLISSVVINKKILNDLKATSMLGVKLRLIQVELVINAIIRSNYNLYLNRYLIACKRNNTGGYDFFEIFVKNLSIILDGYTRYGLLQGSIRALETKMLLTHFPLYIYRLLNSNNNKSILNTFETLNARFNYSYIFIFLIKPAFKLPRFLAKIEILTLIFIGRIIGGDFWRGFWFLINMVKNIFKLK